MEEVKSPVTRKLHVDLNLKIVGEDLESSITQDLVWFDEEPIKQLENVFPFPKPHVFALLSSKVYEHFAPGESAEDIMRRLELPPGWSVLTAAFNASTTNGYSGMAFLNAETHHVMVAHRGTIPTNIGADLADINGIVFNNFVPQMDSAATFANTVTKALAQVSRNQKVHFELFFTGHSLGGWLAQITTFTTKYLYATEENVFQKAITAATFHPHSVTFDSPGAYDMLQQMKEQFDVRYSGSSIDISALDLTTYLAAPNRINTQNKHIGKIYRLFTDLENLGWLHKHTAAYNIAAHSMEKILQTFNPLTGDVHVDELGKLRIQEVIDWPVSGALKRGEEYKGFFTMASTINNFHPDPADIVMKGYQSIRYQTKNFCDNTSSTTVFTKEENAFLVTFLQLRELSELISNDGLYPAFEQQFATLLNSYNISDGHIICSNNERLQKTIPFVKLLLKLFPMLPQKVADNMSLIGIIQGVYSNETEKFLAEHDKLKCIELAVVKAFVKNKTQTLLQLRLSDMYTSVAASRCFDSYVNCMTETEFTQPKQCTVLNASKFGALQETFLFRKLTEKPHLFIIACDHETYSTKDIESIKSLVNFIQEGKKCKVITVHYIGHEEDMLKIRSDLEGEPGSYSEYAMEELKWNDLLPETQRSLLNKTLNIQNKPITLTEFLGETTNDNRKQKELASKLTFLNSSVIMEILQSTVDTELLDFSKIGSSSDLDAMYFSPSLSITNNQLVEMLLNNEASLFILSDLTKSQSTDSLLKRLCLEYVQDKTGQSAEGLVQIITSSCTVRIIERKYFDHEFKCISRVHPKNQIHWLTITTNVVIWNMSYNEQFYKTRTLKKIFVNSALKKRLLTQTSNKIYVVAGFSSRSEFSNYIGLSIEDFHNIRPLLLIIEDLEEAKKEFYQIIAAGTNKIIHLLVLCRSEKGRNLILLHKHTGNTEVDDRIVSCSTSNEDFFQIQNDNIVALVDEAGAGKTTAITRLCSSRISTHLILKVNCRNVHNTMAAVLQDDVLDVQKFVQIVSHGSLRSLAKALVLHRLEDKNQSKQIPVIVVVDEFDEIPETSQIKLAELLNHLLEHTIGIQIIVAARRYSRLEQYLPIVYNYELSSFTPDEQVEFLEQLLNNTALQLLKNSENVAQKAKEYAVHLLFPIQPVFGISITTFTGNPLNLRLLAELFSNNFIHFLSTPFDSAPLGSKIISKNVYDRFVIRKLSMYFQQRPFVHGLYPVLEDWIQQKLVSFHRSYALRTMFPDQSITKDAIFADPSELTEVYGVGLLTPTNNAHSPNFIHSTFAEYFLVDLVADAANKNIYTGIEDILVEILSDPKFCSSRTYLEEGLSNIISFNVGINKSSIAKDLVEKIALDCTEDINTALNICALENRTHVFKYILECFSSHEEILVEYLSVRNSDEETILYTLGKNFKNKMLGILFESVKNLPTHMKERLILSTALRSEFEDVDDNLELVLSQLIRLDNAMEYIIADVRNLWPVAKIFLSAVRNGNLENIQAIMTNITNDNHKKYVIAVTSCKYKNALHIAAELGYVDIVSWLILQRLNINVRDKNSEGKRNSTPLHIAAGNGHMKIVELLLNDGANAESKDRNGASVVHRAVRFGNLDVAEYLVRTVKANVFVKDKSGMSTASWAARNGHDAVLMFLLEQGVSLDDADRYGMTPLHHAAKMGHSRTISFLVPFLDEGKINVANSTRLRPIHYVVKQGKQQTILFMIQHGANVDNLNLKEEKNIIKSILSKHPYSSDLYAIVRTNNPSLFQLYLNTNFNNYKTKPETRKELVNNLSGVYNKILASNMQFSAEIMYQAREILISSRFACAKTESNLSERRMLSLDNVKDRIKDIIEDSRRLQIRYKCSIPVDDNLLRVLKYIAKNIRILKRVLKASYNLIPWEEMEFCLCIFVLVNSTHKPEHFSYGVFMSKTRLLEHLKNFTDVAHNFAKTIQHSDMYGRLPKINTDIQSFRQTIIRRNKKLESLYADHDQIRTMHSLMRIGAYIKPALSVNPDRNPKLARLFIERALQVVGECLKYSMESPNMSIDVLKLLQMHAPGGLIETAKSVRDSLSHSFTMNKRLSTSLEFDSLRMQNDLKKIETEIKCILLARKIQAFKVLCQLISESRTIDECLILVKPLDKTVVEDVYTPEMFTQEMAALYDCVKRFRQELILNDINEEHWKQELYEATSILDQEKLRSKEAKWKYTLKCTRIAKILRQISERKDMEGAQNIARTYLIDMKSANTDREFHLKPLWLLGEVYKHIESAHSDKVPLKRKLESLLEAYWIRVGFNTNNIRIIEGFKNQLNEKDTVLVDTVKMEIDEILTKIMRIVSEKGHAKEAGKLEEVFKTQNEIYNTSKKLTKLLQDLNVGTVSKDTFVQNELDWLISRLEKHLSKKKTFS